MLLLFIIGLELQPSRLWALRKPVFGLGGLQFFGVGALLIGVAYLLGLDWPIAILVGLTLALSSTAFVLPTLAERRELHSRYGRETFAILLFQDLMVIPLLALLPLLGATQDEDKVSPVVGLVVLGVVIAIGRPILDRVFRHVSRIDSREMFWPPRSPPRWDSRCCSKPAACRCRWAPSWPACCSPTPTSAMSWRPRSRLSRAC